MDSQGIRNSITIDAEAGAVASRVTVVTFRRIRASVDWTDVESLWKGRKIKIGLPGYVPDRPIRNKEKYEENQKVSRPSLTGCHQKQASPWIACFYQCLL